MAVLFWIMFASSATVSGLVLKLGSSNAELPYERLDMRAVLPLRRTLLYTDTLSRLYASSPTGRQRWPYDT
uniref:Putative secreted protein n=1 Tax=Anopheles darlingi TaxID=43151 RepID=A0A2M4DA14_ANODA